MSTTVREGSPLNFTVTIKPSDVKVEYQYNISETGNFVETRRLGLNTKGISARRYNQITVNTNPVNPEFEPDSVVTLQLEPGLQRDGRPQATPTYFIDPAGSGSASVTVTDSNTPANGLSIVAFNTVINEGDNAEYQIRSASAVTQATEVIVKFTNDTAGRNFITQANLNRPSSITPSADLIHVVNIPSGQNFVDFSVPTVDLPGNGESATITAVLQTNPSSTYSLASSNTSAVVSVINPNIPRVSFAIVTPTITEGGTAQVRFTLTSANNNYQIPPEGIDIDFFSCNKLVEIS